MTFIQITILGLSVSFEFWPPSQFYRKKAWFAGISNYRNQIIFRLLGFELHLFANNPIAQ